MSTTEGSFGSLAPVIARNVKARRDEAGISQDQFAARLQEKGLEWGRNSVAWLETGKREPTVTEFLFLAAALGVRPAELLKAEGHGIPGGLSALHGSEPMVSLGLAEVPAEAVPGLLSGKGLKYLTAVWESSNSPSEAEKAVASKLGLAVDQVRDLGYALWGRRLDDERDERAGHPTGPGAHMKKAHATRKLLVELVGEARKQGWLADDTQDTKPKRARKEQKR